MNMEGEDKVVVSEQTRFGVWGGGQQEEDDEKEENNSIKPAKMEYGQSLVKIWQTYS